LAELLGVEPPASVRALDPDAQAKLTDIVADARQRQARALEAALTAAMRHVPFPVRGIVKKVLFG
jgi:hypothetical protein